VTARAVKDRLEQVMGDIFISYAREDHQAAGRLAEALKEQRLVGVVGP
jgi:hypothetical protein